MRQLITLPAMGELIPAKPALPENVAQARFLGELALLGLIDRLREGTALTLLTIFFNLATLISKQVFSLTLLLCWYSII